MLLGRLPRPPPLNVRLLLARLCTVRGSSDTAAVTHDSWVAKVVSTVFLLSPSSTAAARLGAFREALLDPSIAVLAIHRLGSPKLAVEFFSVAGSSFSGDTSVVAMAYVAVIGRLCQSGRRDLALELFAIMPMRGHPSQNAIFACLVNSFLQADELDSAMVLLRRAAEFGCRMEPYVYNGVLSLLMARGRAQEAVEFFCADLGSQYFTPDTCSFNIVIKVLLRTGETGKASEFVKDMERFGCRPDSFTYGILVDGLCKAKQVDRGREILRKVMPGGLGALNVVTYTSVILGYCREGKMTESRSVFDEMVGYGISPSQITYNILIDGYGKIGDISSAVSIYNNMVSHGCSPDVVTFTSLIDAYCRCGRVDDALRIWHEMCEKNVRPNVYTFAIVVSSLCKVNRVSEARGVLIELKGRADIVATKPFVYNPVIDGLCKSGNVDEANLVLMEMEEKRCFPDKVTYTILIIGHCMKGRMSDAITLFNKMVTSGCTLDSIAVNSLVSCLLKAGMPGEASRIMMSEAGKMLNIDSLSSKKVHGASSTAGITAVA